MNKLKLLTLLLAGLPAMAGAQQIKSHYVDWGERGTAFPARLDSWSKGQKWTDDDNFFISRVKPRERFVNRSTQVNPAIDDTNDKKLIFWVPCNNQAFNALPDGKFDSEVFPMWSYVTHYGNWSTQLVRLPGNFADVAHKNGVGVSVVASVPYGQISSSWQNALKKMVGAGPEKMADFLTYYGIDGLGYNSEFATTQAFMTDLTKYHSSLMKLMRQNNPLADIIWYDGTSESGNIMFDRGLGTHNDGLWVDGENPLSSLFFNYNWNRETLLKNSVSKANELGRTPLDLYCGINMQGREPHNSSPSIWTLLAKYPLSIGLWGAHEENMFFESRAEKGPSPESRQRSYMKRVERWFSGGTRNPANSPAITNSLIYAADNSDFFGMSKMMSARSALKWDLGEEPFITYFNLGNGKFMNWQGRRQHDSEWYNIGVQDYLPTWMWWFSGKFLGHDAADVPVSGLDAEFVWDDAWVGGSLVRVFGTTEKEYLHLFKTEYALRDGDEITVRYKVINGTADIRLALSAKGAETELLDASRLVLLSSAQAAPGEWIERKFKVGADAPSLSGKELAVIALDFENARDLDLRLGEFSIIRGDATSATPAKPGVERAEILSARHNGVDAKIIYNMPNTKGDDVCYNIDVNTSLFKLYAQHEGGEPVMMGLTTSWAGLLYSIPCDAATGSKTRIGVSALSLDMKNESDVAWSDWMETSGKYEISDNITLKPQVVKPGQSFLIEYDDPGHEPALWKLLDDSGKTVAQASSSKSIEVENGLQEKGNYTLVVEGYMQGENGREKCVRELPAFLQITDESTGNIPSITAFSAGNPEKPEQEFKCNEPVDLRLTAQTGSAVISRGVKVGETAMGFKGSDAGLDGKKSFTVTFWFKPETFKDKAIHMLNIRDKEDKWAVNNWGWFWHELDENGKTSAFTLRMSNGQNLNYKFDNSKVTPGVWHHFAYVFDFNETGKIKPSYYVDGKLQEVTSWSRGDVNKNPSNLTYEGAPATWRTKNVVAVGGYLHKSGSVRGSLDNLMLWNSALDSEGVKKAMEDIDTANTPAELTGYFNFDQAPDSNGGFQNLGASEFRAIAHDYVPTEVEGQGVFTAMAPQFTAGCPFLKGDAYPLEATVSYEVENGRVYDIKGDASEGSAKVEFFSQGKNRVRVRVANDYGEDIATAFVNVNGTGNGLELVEDAQYALNATPNPFDDHIDITALSDGRHRISLIDLNGRCYLYNDFDVVEGETMTVYPDVPKGIYILNVTAEGEKTGAMRVIRR